MSSLAKRVLCHAPITDVFEALCTDSVIAEWMTAAIEFDPRVDGSVVVAIAGWPELRGHVVEFTPPRRLVLRWQAEDWRAPAILNVDLVGAGTECWVMIEEAGFVDDDEVFAQREVLWSHWLIRLAAVVARAQSSS